MRVTALLLLLAGCAAPTSGEPARFLAGAASVDLTPSRNLALGGYGGRKGAPMTGVHDPVRAKALWLETPTDRVCLVTTDLIGSLVSIRDLIKPDDASVVLEWHRDRQAFYVGAVGYQRMRDAAGAALAVGRARKGQTA